MAVRDFQAGAYKLILVNIGQEYSVLHYLQTSSIKLCSQWTHVGGVLASSVQNLLNLTILSLAYCGLSTGDRLNITSLTNLAELYTHSFPTCFLSLANLLKSCHPKE
eukprot:SM001802S03479  [mRNA]  locus=s1802:184:920:- [translate_table: standard]